MANTLRIKRSNTATITPTSLLEGELAANIIDKKIWIGSSSQVPILISDINGSGGGIALTDISSSAVGLNYDYTTGNFSTSEGYEIPLTSTLSSITTAYNDRLQWDGSATSLITETGRTSLGINAVENTALSTWAGSTNITTVGSATTRNLTIAPLSQSATTASKCLTVTGPAHTNLTASSSCTDIHINLARTVQFAWGSLPAQTAIKISAPTYDINGFASASGATTVQIDSAPIAGANTLWAFSSALNILTGVPTGVGIVITGATSQSVDIFRINNSTSQKPFSISNTGAVVLSPFGTSAGNTNELRFLELSSGIGGGNYVGFKAADNIASNVIWTLPAADGTAGQVLSTNASGALSWITSASKSAVSDIFLANNFGGL